ncbi:hypothetical protein [Limnoglobus roseus]|uniref:Chromosome partition protein Smc n=1 Tax=Limnoglobus roseus TaxID=2598579 RepID=A0A5C1AQ70_9BACT|nr:hypothetical protein [Limnoglobus roseus]QEL20203.1 hypothetical protein PX52LOC_07292 [Limnoglobus roseus]
MKKIAMLAVALGLAVAGARATMDVPQVEAYREAALRAVERVQYGIEANPVPIVIALGTFLLTVVYHKAKGKSFRESVEVAATRVTILPAPAAQLPPAAPENVVLKRAQARATRSQLLADQVEIRTRIAKLPEAVVKAEKDACYAEKAVADLKRILGEKHKTRNTAVAKLEGLQTELATGERELAEIESELEKLAVVA